MKQAAFRVFFLVLLLSSHRLYADTLVGQNGDRIAGQFVEEKSGKIVFNSDLFGRLELASSKARIERDTVDATPRSPNEQAAQQETPRSSALSPHWSLDVGLKINLDRGSLETSEDRLDARLTLERQTERGEWHGDFVYKYKSTEGELRDDDWQASLAYDRFVSERRFNAGRLMMRSELVETSYDGTQALTLATGWRLWETPKHYLRIGPALGYLAITRDAQAYDGAVFGLYARAMTPLLGRAKMTGELQLLDTLGDGRYGTMAIRIRNPLTEKIYVSLGWDYVWSDFDIESGISSVWRWDIGWRFGPAESD